MSESDIVYYVSKNRVLHLRPTCGIGSKLPPHKDLAPGTDTKLYTRCRNCFPVHKKKSAEDIAPRVPLPSPNTTLQTTDPTRDDETEVLGGLRSSVEELQAQLDQIQLRMDRLKLGELTAAKKAGQDAARQSHGPVREVDATRPVAWTRKALSEFGDIWSQSRSEEGPLHILFADTEGHAVIHEMAVVSEATGVTVHGNLEVPVFFNRPKADDSTTWRDYWERLLREIPRKGEVHIVMHNAWRHDLPLLKAELDNAGLRVPSNVQFFDTVPFLWTIFGVSVHKKGERPPSCALAPLAKHVLGLEHSEASKAHTADRDAEVLMKIMRTVLRTGWRQTTGGGFQATRRSAEFPVPSNLWRAMILYAREYCPSATGIRIGDVAALQLIPRPIADTDTLYVNEATPSTAAHLNQRCPLAKGATLTSMSARAAREAPRRLCENCCTRPA